jgi:hypothetical protein
MKALVTKDESRARMVRFLTHLRVGTVTMQTNEEKRPGADDDSLIWFE